jgi:hypothetical protein
MIPVNSKRRKSRSKRLTDKLSELSEELNERFFAALRRPPLENDRIFYWTYCYSDAEIKDQMIQTMLHANTPQHLIYVYDKTGFMVGRDGYERLSKEEKKEIRAAALEYEALRTEKDDDIYLLDDYNDFGRLDEDPLVNALYILGNFIERHVNSGEHAVDVQRFICAHLILRAYRLVRAIFRSQRYTTSEESLVLVRSLYEIYCKLAYATQNKRNAQYLLDSDFGLASGQFEFQRDGTKLKRHILVDKKTKRTIPRTRSFYEYVSSSTYSEDTELFPVLYEYLSSFYIQARGTR